MSDQKEGIKDIKFTGLEVEIQGKLMIIKFTVPKRRNAITTTMYSGLSHYLKSAASDSGITIVALTGTGAFYSSGNDFGQLFSQSVSDGSSEDMASRGMNIVRDFIDALIDFPKPLIAVLNGPAVGVAVTSLALMDAVYAVENAWLHCPFTNLGLCPEGCSSVTFPSMMGQARATEMLYFNKKVTAHEACQLGLITEVYPEATFHSQVWPKLRAMSELPSQSLVYAKQLCRSPHREILHQANHNECECLKKLATTEDTIMAITKHFSGKSKL